MRRIRTNTLHDVLPSNSDWKHEGFVRGLIYGDADVAELNLKRGDKLTLALEPSNPADPGAVAIYHNGVKLGYMAQDENHEIHEILDSYGRNTKFRCVVKQFAKTNPTHRMIRYTITVKVPEDDGLSTGIAGALRSF